MKHKSSKTTDKKGIVKKIVAIVVIVALLVAGFFVAKHFISKKAASGNDTGFIEHEVSKGDIAVVISGSGTIEANEQYEITSLVTGDVLSASFEEGDQVKEGDVLYQIDTGNVENSIKKAKNSVESAKISYDDALEQVSKLNVSADCSGTVTTMYVKEGDSVAKGTKIADVVDDSVMILKIPFNVNDADNLRVGQDITVRLDTSSYEIGGTISKISSGASSSSTGVSVKNVEIKVVNPGTLKKGERAIAYTSEYACNEAGTFDVFTESTITSQGTGDIVSLSIEEGDVVRSGQIVANLESKSVTDSVRRSELSYDDAKLNLENLYDGMEDYTITAPISGTVINKTTKAGDKLDNTNKSTVMAVVADMSRMLFDILVDELDIAKLEVGQKVSITADALEGKIFSGYIDKISIIGTTSNGVTTYPVTVVVENPEGLIPGMNVDANITVEEVKDVVSVPVSALMRGNMVAVKSGATPKAPEGKKSPEGKGDNKSANAGNKAFGKDLPEGFELRKVEIGLSNSDSVEIISGLKEGDVVLVQQIAATSMMDMFKGMTQGGMPHGGMPSGAMGGGGMPAGAMGGNRSGAMSGGSR